MKNYIIAFLFFGAISSITNAQPPNWQWAKNTSSNNFAEGRGISTDANGNSYVTGVFASHTLTFNSTTLTKAGGNFDIFIAKYDATGNLLWAKGAPGNSDDYGQSITTDANGNAYITGQFGGTVYPLDSIIFDSITLFNVPNRNSLFIAKYDSMGKVLWAKSVGGYSVGETIRADGSGNVYIAGHFGPTISFGSTP